MSIVSYDDIWDITYNKNKKKTMDFKFGENISEPLNVYFTTHIADIIDNVVLALEMDYEGNCDKLLDIDFFKEIVKGRAYPFIERKYWHITDEAFDIMFEDKDFRKTLRDAIVNVKMVKNMMKNMGEE